MILIEVALFGVYKWKNLKKWRELKLPSSSKMVWLSGFGTGSTAYYFVEKWVVVSGRRPQITAVTTSSVTLAGRRCNIPLKSMIKWTLNLTVDGTNEVDSQLVPESKVVEGPSHGKVVTTPSKKNISGVVDESKLVEKLECF